MKKLITFIALSLLLVLNASAINITETGGWFETAFIKWDPVTNADSYNVYISGMGLINQKIDNQLIRSYGTYMRADVPGLKAGTYTISVAEVIGGTEQTATTSGSITVIAHDRNGFAFANGRIPGAYKADGTLKDNAIVLYVTENTKNTITLSVTGANANPCVGIQTILDAFKKGKDLRPVAVRLIGQVTDPSYTLGGDIVIENNNNAASYITFEGIGDDAVADGWGIRVKNASNIEIRNIGTMNCNSSEGDNIGLQQSNDYVWVHNCDLFYGDAGSDADQVKGDGAMDCKKSTYVTFSYNHFWDSGKCNLLGLSEGTTSGLYITYHHNWYDHSDSRHPRVRYYSAHVYNNYYDGNAKYGVGSTMGSSVFVENNYFRNCKYPMMTSMQGTDVYNGALGTFSGEDGGSIKSFNNVMSGQTRYVAYNATNYPVEFDAIEAATRSELISNTIKSKQGANTYNNFDTDISLYVNSFVPDAPEVAKTNVMAYAGRINGGDLKWTFNNSVDDASYAVNTGLKSALTAYKTKLVSIQGETPTNGGNSSQTLSVPDNSTQAVAENIAIEPIVFTWGGDATDASVIGLPASGISFVKDAGTKTITITGTPTATVNYTVTTSGATGTPVSASGTISISYTGPNDPSMVHNFTVSGKTSSFYTITGNLSTSYGTVTYNSLGLTQCLKMESSTNITFTTTQSGVYTLVYNPNYAGSIKVDNVTYNITAAANVITIPIAAGSHTLVKGSGSTYLFYMSTVYDTVNGVKTPKINDSQLYPVPVGKTLFVNSANEVKNVEVYSLSGVKVLSDKAQNKQVDVSKLNKGNYFVKVTTTEGVSTHKLIKE